MRAASLRIGPAPHPGSASGLRPRKKRRGGGCGESGEGQQDPVGGPQPQVRPIAEFAAAGEEYAAGDGRDVLSTQPRDLLGENLLESLRSRRKVGAGSPASIIPP